MAKNADHVQHLKSSVVNELEGIRTPKLPNPSALTEGEIAINYADGVETISIKNVSGDIVTFSSDDYYTEKKLGSGFTGANSAVTVTEALENIEIDVDQVIDSGTSASTNAVATKAVYEAITDNELVWTNAYVAMSGIVSAHTASTEIHLANGDREKINSIDTLSGTVTAHTANTEIHVTTGTVQTLIDNSISGKVNTSDIISAITPSNSGSTAPIATKIVAENELVMANALTDLDERKLDISAYTPTDLSNYYTKSETSGKTEISNALGGKSDTGHTHAIGDITNLQTTLDGKANTATTLAGYSISDAYTKSETSGATEISNALGTKVNSATYTGHTADTTVHFTTGTVQTLIDNSISGKVNTSDIISAITPSNSASTAPIATKVVAENELVMSNALNHLNSKGVVSAVTVSSNLNNVVCPNQILGSEMSGAQAAVVYVNSGATTDYTITVSTTYETPDGNQLNLTCPKNGYCEISYLNINGTIYARGI